MGLSLGNNLSFLSGLGSNILGSSGIEAISDLSDWILSTGVWNDDGNWVDTEFWRDGPKQWILATGVWNDSGFWDDFSNWTD
jgi:hypothetical protein